MLGRYRWLLRLVGFAVIAVSLLAHLPGPWSIGVGVIGLIIFFLAGPT